MQVKRSGTPEKVAVAATGHGVRVPISAHPEPPDEEWKGLFTHATSLQAIGSQVGAYQMIGSLRVDANAIIFGVPMSSTPTVPHMLTAIDNALVEANKKWEQRQSERAEQVDELKQQAERQQQEFDRRLRQWGDENPPSG